jgi:hypothetical protein
VADSRWLRTLDDSGFIDRTFAAAGVSKMRRNSNEIIIMKTLSELRVAVVNTLS